MNSYYKPPYFSPHNPFFRKQLLTSSNGKLIVDILIELGEVSLEHATKALSIEDIADILWKIILLFSDGSGLSIRSILPNAFELRSFNLSQAFHSPSGILFPHDNGEKYFSIRALMYKERAFFDLNNYQIDQAYLLKETAAFVKSCSIPNWMNDMGTRGIGFTSVDNKFLNIYVGNEQSKKNLHIDFNENIVLSGLLERNLSFNNPGIPIKGRISRRSFFVPRIKVKAKYAFTIKHKRISQVITSHKNVNQNSNYEKKKNWANFLMSLKKAFVELNFGVPDMKLGILDNGNICLITPVDLSIRVVENERFIDVLYRSINRSFIGPMEKIEHLQIFEPY